MNIKSTRRWIFVAFAWLAMIYVGTSSPLMAGTTTRALFGNYDGIVRSLGHMCEFFILAFVCYGVTVTFRIYGWKGVAVVLLIAAIAAFLDEYHQMFVPGRSYKLIDIVKDMVGAGSAILVAKIPAIRRRVFREKSNYRRVVYYV